MVSFIAAFKEQIRRLARKEIRAQIAPTKRAAAQHRRDIARIKRQLMTCLRRLEKLETRQNRGAVSGEPAASANPKNRFSARSVRAQRKRLKFSAAEYGRLVGVSGQTIYQWEQGKSRPRKSQFASLIALRSIGRREALARVKQKRPID
ncbi:MAG TPA: helix-turn-helix domain-containing protein [Pirellulales bacterium]|jgi:DNA-binding transcriptional regulator YiaG|nr:helix-turn-helix domain-containing protein [Pirellulales bacterium]